jgi:hypothetical protein
MKEDTKSADITPNPNSNPKGKKGKRTKTDNIVAAVFFFLVGGGALFGSWKVEPTAAKVTLYVIASLATSLGSFGLLEALTPKANSNYSLAAMFFALFGFLMYASSLTDINALRWLSIGFAILFGFGALIALIVQVNKDIRQRPIVKWVIAMLLIAVFTLLFTWLFERPVILSLIPFALIVLYNEYLMTTYLNKPIVEPQTDHLVSDKGPIIVATFRSLPKTLRSIRRPVYLILIVFSAVFYFTITQQSSQTCDFSIFYQAVTPAYFGILAIVIAFAVLVIRRDTKQRITGNLRLAINGLVQMYVVFALVNVFGLLIGTDVTGEILTSSTKLNDIIGSADNILHVFQPLVLQFNVSAFPVGLLYLYAMIRDFMTPQVGGSNHS